MVYINIIGGTKRQKRLTKSMVEFCYNKLMPRMYNLQINIQLRNFGKDNSYGYCLPCDDADTARPREFDIDVNKNVRLRRMMETVAHEMVHAKQFARGELYESTVQHKHRWCGKWLDKKLDYYDQPWEIEAHGREVGLFVRWCEAEGIADQQWVTED